MVTSDATNQHSDTTDQLKALLSQSQARIEALEGARVQEAQRREQIEAELQSSRQLLQLVMDTLPEAIFWKDRNLAYLGCNHNFAEDAGVGAPENLIGKTDYDMPWTKEESDFFRECDRQVMLSDQAELGIVEPQLNNDGQHWLETNKVPLHDLEGQVIGILGTYQDITQRKEAEIALQALNQRLEQQATELTAALSQLQHSQLQLIQQEKMSALGNLVAGIAHEMNNPVGFLAGNLKPAKAYTADLLRLLSLYQEALPEPGEKIEEEIEAIDLEYLREDLPKLLASMDSGIQRIRDMSVSLRTFSRGDTEYKVPFDLREGIDSTISILKHRLKASEHRPMIKVVRNYHEMSPVMCFPGQMNQVFMNLLSNAVDALEEANREKSFSAIQAAPNCITITTKLSVDRGEAIICIQDNGTGMTEATQQRVFENLFTTKGVGKGTGLGMAIAYQIIVEKHGGTIDIDSVLGQGTQFIIYIPTQVA